MRSLALALIMCASPLFAQGTHISKAVPNAELRGEAIFRLAGLPIYKAQLFTEFGAALDWDERFALELTYLRRLSTDDLVESTMRELNRTGPSLPLRSNFKACFQDVEKGDRFAAITSGPDKISFWLNGRRTCVLAHPKISSRFMGIFLGENTRSKSFTRRLKGM